METNNRIMKISRHKGNISKYNEEIHKKQSKINSNNKNIMDCKNKISKTKNISSIKSYYGKIATLEFNNAKLNKEIRVLQRKSMSEQKEANRLEKQIINNSVNNNYIKSDENIFLESDDTDNIIDEIEEEKSIKPYVEIVKDFCKDIKRNGLDTKYGKISEIKDAGTQGGNGRILFGKLNNHDVAIKVLYNNENGKINRFYNEFLNVFMSLQKVKGIVELYLYESIEYDGGKIYYIIMKKYKENLAKTKIERNERNIVKLFIDLCNIIEQIHNTNIVHRDIKPENILIDEKNEVVLSDFGIAYFNPNEYENTGHTMAGEILGNRKFSAPEQSNKGIEPHVTMDIYALGQIMQWFVTENTHSGTGRKELHSVTNGAMIRYLDIIIDKCIRFDPQERYQSINEIYEDLKKYDISIKDNEIAEEKFNFQDYEVERDGLGLGDEIVVI